jgi:hypothetical protein
MIASAGSLGPWNKAMRRTIVNLALFLITGCTIQRAIVANQAQHDLVGMSKEQILACMGPPTDRQAEGATEVWAYPSGGRTDTFSTAQAYGSGAGTYSGMTTGNLSTGTSTGTSSATAFGTSTSTTRYCVVDVVFNRGMVSAVNYQGRTGGLITQGEECAFAVENCVH